MHRLIALFVLSGCSFAFVSGPPDNYRQAPYFNCTESRVAPVLDTIWTGLMVLDVLSLGVTSDADYAKNFNCSPGETNCPAISRHGAMTLDAVLGIAGAAGMVYGYSKTAQCRSAKADAAARQQPYQPMPGSWPPPQGGPGSYPPPYAPGTWPPPQQRAPVAPAPQAAPVAAPAPAPVPAPAPTPQP
jgi:hypothetical protein